jgi:cytoskeletal protein CcmA (bactofilin family)
LIPRRFRDDQSGFSLVTALAVSFIVLLLGTVMMTQVVHSGQVTGRDRTVSQAFNVAEAGLNASLASLATNPNFTGVGTAQSVTAAGVSLGTYTTTVGAVAGAPMSRLVRSVGLSAGTRKEQRIIEETVTLQPLGSFDYALFSASTINLANHLNVNGDAYAGQSMTLADNTNFNGNLVAPGNITTSNNSTFTGLVWSGGNIVIANGTTVNGNVIATGNVTVLGTVTGDVRAATITVSGGTIGGQQISGVTNPAPYAQTLPAYTYSASNYSPAPSEYVSAAAFNTYWSTHTAGMSGVYHVTDATGGSVSGPSQKTTLTGDLTIITDRPITISRDFASNTGDPRRLVIIDTFPCCASNAVTWTNNITLPSNIEVFIYTAGIADFANQKNFHGIVYAQQIVQDQNFTVTYEPDVLRFITGFGWDLSSAGVYDLKPGAWHECNGDTGGCG